MLNALLVGSLCFVWGATWVAIKIGLDDSPPFYGAAFRFVIAVTILGIVFAVKRLRWPTAPGVWLWAAVSGTAMYLGSYAIVYFVAQYIDAALTAILFTTLPFFIVIGEHFYLPNERLTVLKFGGLTIGFIGVVILFAGGRADPSTTAWWAPALMLLSPLFSAVSNLIVKKHLTKEDPIVLNVIQMSIGVALLLPLAFLFEDIGQFHWTTKSVGALLFLAVFGSAFAFVTLYHLLRTISASRLSLIAFVTPVTTVVLSWFILGESLTVMTAIGAALVMIGIYIVNVLAERRNRVPSGVSGAAVETADA